MATKLQPTGPAGQPFTSTRALVDWALDEYFPNWKTDTSHVIPIIFNYKFPTRGQQYLEETAKTVRQLEIQKGKGKVYDEEKRPLTDDKSLSAEHIVHRAFAELINNDECGFHPMFGFASLELINKNGAIEALMWKDFVDEIKRMKPNEDPQSQSTLPGPDHNKSTPDAISLCSVQSIEQSVSNTATQDKSTKQSTSDKCTSTKRKSSARSKDGQPDPNPNLDPKYKKTRGECDFVIISPTIGIICIEVKSASFENELKRCIVSDEYGPNSKNLQRGVSEGDLPKGRLRVAVGQVTKLSSFLASLLHISTKTKIDAELIHRVLLLTDVEKSQYDRLSDKAKSHFSGITVWFKDDLKNDPAEASNGPLFSTLHKFLRETSQKLETFDKCRKDKLNTIYETCVPLLVGMQSLAIGNTQLTKGKVFLDKEKIAFLEAVLSGDKHIEEVLKAQQMPKAQQMQNVPSASQASTSPGDDSCDQHSTQQIFLSLQQQTVLNAGHRVFLFGPGGVGKTIIFWTKISKLIVDERKKPDKERHPIMIMTPASILDKYVAFLNESGFKGKIRREGAADQQIEDTGCDYEISDKYFFNLWFEKYFKLMPILIQFAYNQKAYRAIFATVMLFLSEKDGHDHFARGYGTGQSTASRMLDQLCAYLRVDLSSGTRANLGRIIDPMNGDTFKVLRNPTLLTGYLRSSGIFQKILASFESKEELRLILIALTVPEVMVDGLVQVRRMAGLPADKTIKIDLVSVVEPFIRKAYQQYLGVCSETTPDKVGERYPVFTTMVDNPFGGESDLKVLCNFVKAALADEAVLKQLRAIIDWLPENGFSHMFVEDMLDEDKASNRHPHSFEFGSMLIMEFYRKVAKDMCVWIAADQYKGHIDDYPNDEKLFENMISNLEHLQYTDKKIKEKSNGDRFELKILHDVMRCSRQIYDYAYKRTDTSGIEWSPRVEPKFGHNYLGITPIPVHAGGFETFDEARDALWIKIRERIQLLEKVGLDESQFAVVVGNRFEKDWELYDYLRTVCNVVHKWTRVSSLEWSVVIYANIVPEKIDMGKLGGYRNYRGMSRAKVCLIDFEYTYDEADEAIRSLCMEGVKAKPKMPAVKEAGH